VSNPDSDLLNPFLSNWFPNFLKSIKLSIHFNPVSFAGMLISLTKKY